MAVTLQHIADDLQLSKATVSRSLRNDPLILPRTRAKVHASAVRLGYEGRPRETRRSSSETKAEPPGAANSRETLGLLFPATNLNQARQDLNFVHIMQGVIAETERYGKLLMIQAVSPQRSELMEENPEEIPAMIREGVCQALIVRGSLPAADIAFLSRHVPVITVARIYSEASVDAVVPDSVIGVHNLVTRLVELGHRRLAWVGGHYTATFLDERQAGFVTGCLHHNLDLRQQRFLGQEIYMGRRLSAHGELLQIVREGTTALVCGNDSIARQAIEVLEAGGLSVPQDVSVTGFDAQQPGYHRQRITSVDPRFIELGRAAVRLAVQRLTQSASSPCVLTVRSEYLPGNTIAPPKQAH